MLQVGLGAHRTERATHERVLLRFHLIETADSLTGTADRKANARTRLAVVASLLHAQIVGSMGALGIGSGR